MYKPLRFWGTSGGTGVPSPFCKCPVCENARNVGGKEFRSRSAFRIDKKVMIDIGEDYVSTAAKLQDELYENGTIDEKTKIFITHIDCKGKNHVQLEEYFANINRSYNVIVAYDGLSVCDL